MKDRMLFLLETKMNKNDIVAAFKLGDAVYLYVCIGLSCVLCKMLVVSTTRCNRLYTLS